MYFKPCPFCGGEGKEYEGERSWHIECSACWCEGPWTDTLYMAISAWNHRHGEDAMQARVEALEWLRECEALEHMGWMYWHPSGWRDTAAHPKTLKHRRNHVLRVILNNSRSAREEFESILAAARAAVECR